MNSRRNDYRVRPRSSKQKWFDLFVGFNLVLFLGMCLQDLIANLCGGLFYWSVSGLVVPRLRVGLSPTQMLRPEP